MYRAANDLYLYTRLTRVAADGTPVECDVLVKFEVESFSPGYRATWAQPAEGPEFELSFAGAEFDGGAPDDAPGPMTAIETDTLRRWFNENHARASEVANDNHEDAR